DERDEFRKIYSTPMSPTEDGGYLMQTWDYLKGLGAHTSLELHHRELVDTVRAYWGRYQVYSAVWDQDFTAFYKQVKQPMLIMCAEEDVLMPFFGRAQEMRPDARAVTINGKNFEPDQDPQGVTAAFTDFLEGLG
ncbi:MAG: hypothetical protein AAGL49_01420, partial [Pseudomonadota bacterium]